MIKTKYEDIISILKFFHFVYAPLGLKRTNFHEGVVTQTGKLYKIYATILSIIFLSLASYFSYKDVELTIRLFGQSLSVQITTSFYYIVIVSIYFLLSYHGIYLEPDMKSKIYNDLIKIDKFLKMDDEVSSVDCKKKLLLFYVPYLIFKNVFIAMEIITWKEYCTWSRHIISFMIDCEVVRFSIETNLISKTLKIVSEKLKKINLKNNCKYCSGQTRNKLDEKSLENLIFIHDKLFDTINGMNACYSLKV